MLHAGTRSRERCVDGMAGGKGYTGLASSRLATISPPPIDRLHGRWDPRGRCSYPALPVRRTYLCAGAVRSANRQEGRYRRVRYEEVRKCVGG